MRLHIEILLNGWKINSIFLHACTHSLLSTVDACTHSLLSTVDTSSVTGFCKKFPIILVTLFFHFAHVFFLYLTLRSKHLLYYSAEILNGTYMPAHNFIITNWF